MKRDFSIGYFSSYDRGLECLLKMWPKIKELEPKATLDIYYGWNTFDKVHSNNPEQMQWKWQMIKLMRQDGVTEHGRVSHEDLAKAMQEIKVWAYPTEFTEVHCITALKTVEAGCVPVTTHCYALESTIADDTFSVKVNDIYTNTEAQEQFISNVVKALKSNHKPKRAENRYWTDVAKVWSGAMV